MICKIPISKTYVKKWAIARYGDGKNTTALVVSRRTLIGRMLELSAEKIGFRHVLPKGPDYPVVLEVDLPGIKNALVHPVKLPLIGKGIEALCDEDLFHTIEFHLSIGNSDYVAVQHFCDRYGLTVEDVNEENLRKKWRDHMSYLRKKVLCFA